MRIGRVYKIVAGQSNECYVGSTFDELRYRFRSHKYDAKKENRRQCAVLDLFDKYGIDNCSIMLIKEYEVEDRRHLEVYETLWIKKLKAINRVEPCGGLLKKAYKKQYREDNQDRIRDKTREYREKHKEKKQEQGKKWREANRDKVKENMKQWREANREYELAHKKEKIECECGLRVCRSGFARHRKSKNHEQLIASKT